MERHERQAAGRARERLPEGFFIVRDGDIRTDDLIFSWSSNEWIRADSGDWLQPTSSMAISDCVAVARSARFQEPGFENVERRNYRLPTTDNAGPGVEVRKITPDPTLRPANQGSLF